ncbi:MAG: radical SAM protein, partial [Acidobacteriota bacterium]
ADLVFTGEMAAASELATDLSLYHANRPNYAILTTSRGCPWDCHYCAARTLNGGSNKVRGREAQNVLAEIEHKSRVFGIKRFGFYEDNSLILRGHLREILELVIQRGLKLELYAPEGFETRLLDVDLLRSMKGAGFAKIHLPFEALRWETNLGWNRRHANTASFEAALDAAIQAGFRPRTEEINAFVLFGLPNDALEYIVDGALYVHHTVGSIIPMLFTPVPGTEIFGQQQDYLFEPKENGRRWDLQDLNGKLLPFLEYNRHRYPNLHASDYLELEGLMSILNSGKILRRSVDLLDQNHASMGFREAALRVLDRAASLRSHTSQLVPISS